MRIVGKIVKWLLASIAVLIAGVAGWMHLSPPPLLQGAMNYAAKTVCSSHFIAGRSVHDVLASDVHAPAAHPLLKHITAGADPRSGTVTARFFGVFGSGRAVHRDGYGCLTLTGGGEAVALPGPPAPAAPDMAALWPQGERVEPSQDPQVAAILDDPAMTGPGLRGLVVVHDGRIVGERYGGGFSADTPQLGWSMTKTVTAAIVGTLVGEGRLSLDQDDLFEGWSADERSAITVSDLLAMSSGLRFNEDYGGLTDVTRMLFLEPDMVAFAASMPPVAAPGEAFIYSSGSSVLLSRVWQDAFDDPAEAASWPRQALFDPLGMTSAVLEADAQGTFVGSSYLYATARDWARFGELLHNDGVSGNRRILPEGFVGWMREPAPASGGVYARGHMWLPGAGGAFDLPGDTFWLNGHDGQRVSVVPSRGLVVVRMGLTPSRLGYRQARLVEALVRVLE